MRSSLGLASLLCFITWMSLVHATHGPVSSCCLRWSTTIVPLDRIMNYTIQSEGICPIKAVVFQTQSGKRVCSDPHSNWAKRAMEKVDEETKALLKVEQNEEELTSDNKQAVSTTPKTHHGRRAGQERGGRGRGSRAVKRWQRRRG
ncbi:eotaxin-like isoform X2 [Lates japonicus]|uniref:Eotaxin-like isoform X2 n=1 Tax=Lates japonicus TaxID=270547 RepID=A0AAD3NI72_LATJO|nr:eotaxin-like isoform X2 [Lates japonicus]GLD74818.1 eotaxin-like isoform X2 [Lates japonicus]